MGASAFQIVRKVLLPEALPSLISGGTITIATILGYGAMAEQKSVMRSSSVATT